jgi:hypothetical protein
MQEQEVFYQGEVANHSKLVDKLETLKANNVRKVYSKKERDALEQRNKDLEEKVRVINQGNLKQSDQISELKTKIVDTED